VLLGLAGCHTPPAPEASPPAGSESTLATTLVELAEASLRNGELDEADERFRRAHHAQPTAPRPRIGLARVALARNDVETSRRIASAVVEDDPDTADALVLLAEIERRGGAEAQARELLDRALASDVDHLEAHAARLELTGPAPRRLPTTPDEARHLATRHPYDPWAQLQAGRVLATRQPEEARRILTANLWFADLDPASALASRRLLARLDPGFASRRVVPVHVYADETVRAWPAWQMRLRLLLARTTASLAPLLDTVFVPASLQAFSSSGASDELVSIDAAFQRTAPVWPSTGILAGFTERLPPRRSGFWRLGQAQYLGRRMLVRLEPGATESRTLLHEILHLYGGVHVAEEVDSLLNPSGDSLELDPANLRILRALRGRNFGPGGLEANVMPHVDPEELTDSLTDSLRLNLHFRRIGVLEALEMQETSRFTAARGIREARELDPHLASVSRFVATLRASWPPC
jgi:tetratricopeptide (TPR) repeat protein